MAWKIDDDGRSAKKLTILDELTHKRSVEFSFKDFFEYMRDAAFFPICIFAENMRI